jgi:hypothetical protein
LADAERIDHVNALALVGFAVYAVAIFVAAGALILLGREGVRAAWGRVR